MLLEAAFRIGDRGVSAQTKPGAAQVRRPIDRHAMAAISPLPSPQEVFIDWLMSVPHGDCLEAAARTRSK